MNEPRTLVLGVGNLLWADEGFGVRCVEAFARRWRVPEGVLLMDGGTQGLYLVQHIAEAEHLLVFDAVDFGAEPGTLMVVRDAEVPAFIARGKMSLHQAGVSDVLACAELIGRRPSAITVIGAQPVELEDYGGSLTAPIRALLPRAVELAAEELRRWGVALEPGETPAGALMDASLALDAYEQGRPGPDVACRIGDGRVLSTLPGEGG